MPEKKGRRRRRLIWFGALLLVAWLLGSHLIVRARMRSWLERTFEGEAEVTATLFWPWLDATAFGVSVAGGSYRIEADRVTVDLELWGLFGGRAVAGVHLDGLRIEIDEGSNTKILREGDGAAEGADLDPMMLPRLTFDEPEIVLGGRRVFGVGSITVEHETGAVHRMVMDAGAVLGLPFEKATARLVPGNGHLIVSDLKLRAFNGVIGGLVDVHTDRAGAFNGELEWRFVEVGEIWRTYGLSHAEKRRGDLSGRFVFEADRPVLDAFKGKGTLELTRASYYSPISFRVFDVLGLPVVEDSWITRGKLTFACEDELLYIAKSCWGS